MGKKSASMGNLAANLDGIRARLASNVKCNKRGVEDILGALG